MQGSLDQDRLKSLAATFSGALLRPGDNGYEEARRLHNGLIDKRPRLIARCLGTADIVDALGFARESGLEISVRGGGHNVAGRAVTNGGVMIDLSLMRGVRVNPDAHIVRAQGGVTWREFNRETAVHGLATTGGVISTTGIAGLTLGGGLGWLLGKYGLSADNLVSVELVTAAGEVLNVTADEHPDLFWALCGGGGNFGVASSFAFRAHPLREILGGLVAHPVAAAKDVLRFYRDFTASVPDDLTTFAALVHAPDGSGAPLVALILCHCGPLAQAQKDVRPLLEFGKPALVQVGPMPYQVINTILDAAFPRGALNYWKSSFIKALSDEAIGAMIDRFAACPSTMTGIVIEHFHGAATRIGVTDTAVPHREPGYNFLTASVWTNPAETDQNIAWTRATYADMEPYFARRRYVNYLGDDETPDAVQSAYGPNYARLVEIKRRYDPGNLFRLNQNIKP
ncbi:MAG TPA: FAD-binding oxidoreductase [Tepidiformaceae bacterium]|nr:FAD-binding oxidoreductase [Tepidiformaceae bacterium]